MTVTPAVSAYSTTPANNVQANTGVIWDEGMAPAQVNNSARQNMADTRSAFNDLIWFKYGKGDMDYSPVYVSSTSFKIAGADVSTVYHVGRRVRAVGSSTGTIYGTISAVAFSTDTTVTVLWDSGSLSNETLTISISQIPITGHPIGATTGTGSVVLATAPTISGHPTIEGVTSTGATGTGNLVYSAGPTLTGTLSGVSGTFSGQAAVHTTLGGSQGSATFAALCGGAATPAIEAYNNASTGEAFRARVDNTNSPLMNLFFSTTNVGSISTSTTNAAYNTSSDARLKKNIQDAAAANAWAIVNGLRVRSWDWIINDSHEAFGFVAQEEYQVAPFAVTAGDDNPDTIKTQWQRDDSKLVPALVKVVQDLAARLTALEAAS